MVRVKVKKPQNYVLKTNLNQVPLIILSKTQLSKHSNDTLSECGSLKGKISTATSTSGEDISKYSPASLKW